MKNRIHSVLCFIAAFTIATTAFGEMISAPLASDTFITERNPDNNAGGHGHVSSGTSGIGLDTRGLFMFDLSGIPSGSIINSVLLTIDVVGTPGGGGVDSDFGVHLALTDWGEGTGTGNHGSAAASGNATWNNAEHSVNAWSAPGGSGGVDYSGLSSASSSVAGIGTYNWSSAGLAADVQFMLDNPSSNFGWFLISEEEGIANTARRFGSSEGGSPATLTIDFTSSVPEPSTALLLLAGFGILMRVRTSFSGR